MAGKQLQAQEPVAASALRLELVLKPGQSEEQQLAQEVMEGVADSAVTSFVFSRSAWKGADLTHCMGQLRTQVQAVNNGDMKQLEGMLVGQASALASIFHECVRRAGQNMGEHPKAMEQYMRLGLKAQSQCRTTIESLAEIKSPRSVAFVRQANIAQGHQQVNNGVAAQFPGTQAEGTAFQPNELLEVISGERVDAGTTRDAARGNPAMETVGAVNGAAHGGRKSGRKSQRLEGRGALDAAGVGPDAQGAPGMAGITLRKCDV